MKFTISAAGDSILIPELPDYEGFKPIRDFISRGDLRMNNLEMVLANYDCFASTFSGGTWLAAPPERLDDLMKFGFNYLSFANNHTLDYSYGGLLSTLTALEKKGVPYSGAGRSLAEASRPAMVKTPKGSAAVISISSTSNETGRAGDPTSQIPARPGLNMLRHSEVFNVSEAQMEVIKEIAGTTFINGRMDLSKKGGYTLDVPGTFNLGTINFKIDPKGGKTSRPNKIDMERTRRSIEEALKETPYVVISVHSHEIKGLTDDEPDWFIEEFARSCIDWGACAVLGSGTHQLKAVELYKGKPIFYSIANFIFNSSGIPYLPADFFEKYGLSPDQSAAEAIAVRSAGGTRGLETDPMNYRAIMPCMEFEDEKLISLELKPIELGFDGPAEYKGFPREAGAEAAEEIFGRLRSLSEAYGTRMKQDGEGVIRVELG